jgi:hypothetical protein
MATADETALGDRASIGRGGSMIRTIAITACLATLCAGCAQPLDQKKLEGEIQSSLAAKGVDVTSVTCPPTMLKKGTTFECVVQDANGTKGIFDVTATDSKGGVSWNLRGKFENMEKVGDLLEEGLSKKAGQVVDVQCPKKNIIIQKGVTFECTTKVGDKMTKYVFTAKTDDGDWDAKLGS